MALNRGQQPVYKTAPGVTLASSTAGPAGLQTASLGGVDRQALPPLPMPAHVTNGQMYPDPVVMNVPVSPTTIYVQVGSFANPENAARLAERLHGYGDVRVAEAYVQGRKFYRVRLPSPDVDSADLLLDKLVREAGQPKALIIVD
jgi:cell division protein FtsN